ncbi:acetyltransferase [Aeribacillus sp. FSL K6-8394]|uniref:acetyltransferase n=1 Tax=Aeribacillus sp. FSL K6-8394 TaxID=2954570 RepID=UPI0030FCD215
MKTKIVIIGAGGHAKVIIDMLKSSSQFEIAGCTAPSKTESNVQGVPVIGDDSILPGLLKKGIQNAFVAIGDNKKRREAFEQLSLLGFQHLNVISPFSYIAPTVKMGKGVAVMPGAVINADAVIGDNAIINTGATVDHDAVIESHTHIAPGSNVAGNVHVGEGAFIGTGSKVIPNVKIGRWSVIGAGAVVIRHIPDYKKAAGVPARIFKENKP